MAYDSDDALSAMIGAMAKALKITNLQLSERGDRDLERILRRMKTAEIQCDEYLGALRDVRSQLEDATRAWIPEELRAITVIATLRAKTNIDLRSTP
jgi:hypothetical protein